MEKLETVKRLVRENNYKDNDITYKQCMALGVTVNRVGLEIFARKLRAIDKAEEINSHKDMSMTNRSSAVSSSQTERSYIELSDYQSPARPYSIPSNVTHLNRADSKRVESHVDPTERKREITFELGTIKVREHELLQELNIIEHQEKLAKAH